MSSQRGAFTFILLVSVALSLIVTTQAANYTIGAQNPSDQLVFERNFRVPSIILEIVEADQTFHTPNNETISKIYVRDWNKNGNGPTATLTAGGLGFKNVTFHFKSVRGHSIDVQVYLYGQ